MPRLRRKRFETFQSPTGQCYSTCLTLKDKYDITLLPYDFLWWGSNNGRIPKEPRVVACGKLWLCASFLGFTPQKERSCFDTSVQLICSLSQSITFENRRWITRNEPLQHVY